MLKRCHRNDHFFSAQPRQAELATAGDIGALLGMIIRLGGGLRRRLRRRLRGRFRGGLGLLRRGGLLGGPGAVPAGLVGLLLEAVPVAGDDVGGALVDGDEGGVEEGHHPAGQLGLLGEGVAGFPRDGLGELLAVGQGGGLHRGGGVDGRVGGGGGEGGVEERGCSEGDDGFEDIHVFCLSLWVMIL